MARWKKTSEETKAKVTEIKMKDLELSSHDIEAMLKGTEWEVSNDTICDILNSLPQLATTEPWKAQIKRLEGIISGIEAITATVVTKLQLQNNHTVNDVKTLNDISKTNFERLRLLEGKATENKDIRILDYSQATDKELEEIRNRLLD